MNICVCGIGRAGKATLSYLSNSEHIITGALARAVNPYVGMDIGKYLDTHKVGARILSIDVCLDELRKNNTDIIIDFSAKEASMQLLELAGKLNSKLVICTTNHSKEEILNIEHYVKCNSLGVVYAPNLTIGINLLIEFVSELSVLLPDFDFEIVERHNKNKRRGTMTANIISEAIGRGDTHISSVRAGGYVGIHEVICANENERITIEHESFSRQAFTHGALVAADFIYNRVGFYRMSDVIAQMKKEIMVKS